MIGFIRCRICEQPFIPSDHNEEAPESICLGHRRWFENRTHKALKICPQCWYTDSWWRECFSDVFTEWEDEFRLERYDKSIRSIVADVVIGRHPRSHDVYSAECVLCGTPTIVHDSDGAPLSAAVCQNCYVRPKIAAISARIANEYSRFGQAKVLLSAPTPVCGVADDIRKSLEYEKMANELRFHGWREDTWDTIVVGIHDWIPHRTALLAEIKANGSCDFVSVYLCGNCGHASSHRGCHYTGMCSDACAAEFARKSKWKRWLISCVWHVSQKGEMPVYFRPQTFFKEVSDVLHPKRVRSSGRKQHKERRGNAGVVHRGI